MIPLAYLSSIFYSLKMYELWKKAFENKVGAAAYLSAL